MFAIVEIYGKQYKVAKGDKVLVNSKIDVAEGKTIKFDSVKAVSDKDKNIFEAKDLAKYNVSAKVLEHSRDDKVTIIKKKRRKGYQRKRGHRQDLTLLQIQSNFVNLDKVACIIDLIAFESVRSASKYSAELGNNAFISLATLIADSPFKSAIMTFDP